MYFKKLEIFGFKSFAEKTVLNFEPGITAIVGPNGCGKSNVFDAIRWVLGEQSAKQLRGSGMEDVIFNGTDTKLALGFAEVSVTFDNASRTLPVSSDEVIITRRLFRSGESEYLINKEVMRLRDVSELFMGTGVGAEAYSLVQQGKVDLVVSAKPEDRRMIFDEASGITKYKAKKREAQSKLEDTDQNLLRLNDIVSEVKRQISSIERQAQKAQRYKAEFEKLKELEVVFGSWQLELAVKERQEVVDFLSEIRSREAKVATELEDYRQTLERESLLLEDLAGRVSELREKELRLENQIELGQRQIGFNEERLQSLTDNENRIVEQKRLLQEKRRQYEEKINEIEKTLVSLTGSLEAALGSLVQKKEDLAKAVALIEEHQVSIRSDEERILLLNSRLAEIRNHQTDNIKEMQGALARRNRLEIEKTKVSAERDAAEQKLQGLSTGIVELRARRDRLGEGLVREKEFLSKQNEELMLLNGQINKLEKKKVFLVSQKEFIEKLQVQYQDIPDPVITGRFLSPVPPTEKQTGVIGKVSSVQALQADRLGGLKQCLENVSAEALFDVVCETKFIELDPQEMAAQIDSLDRELADSVAAREQLGVLIAEKSSHIESLQHNINVVERELSVAEAKQNDISAENKKLIAEFEVIVFEFEETDRVLAGCKEKESLTQEELNRVEEEISLATDEIRNRQESIKDRNRAREEVVVSVAQMEAEVAALRDKEQGFRENIKMYRTDLGGFSDEAERFDQELSTFNDRRDKMLNEIEALRSANSKMSQEKAELRGIFVRQEAERQDVEQRLSSVRAQISGMEKEVSGSRDVVHEREMRLQQIAFQEQAVRERVLQKYQIDLAPASGDLVAPEASCESAEVPPKRVGRVEVPSDFNSDSVAQEIQALSKRCDAFGAVNLVAIEEFEDLKSRFQFLTKQQADLLTAKDSLEQTIRKINKTTRQLFVDTFTKVNEQFRVYFRMLFNGGEAQLILVDPENALESGIEIVARPPGKKLQTISLLSGGEKTMTAIAMIFSVFRVNPSPFCVLDEIDAALDEANVDRFASVLKEFAKIAQFIVITHNKKTISNANVMYGVTMQQTGVSRVVSVKLTTNAGSVQEGSLGQSNAGGGGGSDAGGAPSAVTTKSEFGQEALVEV